MNVTCPPNATATSNDNLSCEAHSKKRFISIESNEELLIRRKKRMRTAKSKDETPKRQENTLVALSRFLPFDTPSMSPADVPSSDEASLMRDTLIRFFSAWMRTYIYKGRLSAALSKLAISKEDKATIRRYCPQVLKKTVMEAVKELEAIYVTTIPHGCFQDLVRWQTEEFLYADQMVMHTSTRCQIMSATQTCKATKKNIPCIIKCYYRTQRLNSFEELEFSLHRQLVEKGCSVPTLFPSFDTEHYRCYPMERVFETLSTRLVSLLPCGLDNETMLWLAEGIATVLSDIHAANFKYIDMSMNNVGFSTDGTPVLFDFGAVREIYNGLPVKYFTPRYASRNALRGDAVTICDDFESLGYLLLDCCTNGHRLQTIGLREGFSLESGSGEERAKLFEYCAKQEECAFFRDYFSVITSFSSVDSSVDPSAAILSVIEQWRSVSRSK
jgi:hypothetical protein